jgi:hypothetical protein
MFCSVLEYTGLSIDTTGEAALQRDYKHYHKKIDAILRSLDDAQPTDEELQRIEARLNELADTYQTDDALGADRYKLYVSQAMIEYYWGNDQRARAFMEEAVRVKGTSLAYAEEFLSHLQLPQNQWLARINKLTTWQAALIITLIGFASLYTGLNHPFFLIDDLDQIVNNLPVHSIKNIGLFFKGATFYNGQGTAPLTGVYYRPLMITTFSLVYTLFGPHAFYFHLLQLLLCIGSAVLLYMVFRYFFNPLLSLVLSLIFLVHPINSQAVYSLPSMQDALLFFFGILGMWLLLRFRSVRSLWLVAVCLYLSLLAKETGILFVAMALLYLFWFDRKRLLSFVGIVILPVVAYLILKTHAVGLLGRNPQDAPIDNLTLGGRLMTLPSILLLYFTKLIFPWKLSSVYYWVYPTFSVRHVLLPLIIDITIVGLVVWLTFIVRKKTTKTQFYTYLFFAVWAGIGLAVHAQIIPLDYTANEHWFYFSMAGVLGMIGVVFLAFQARIKPSWFIAVAVVLISILGVRTAVRGTDWSDLYTLSKHDIAASSDDYAGYNNVAYYLFQHGEYTEAKPYAERSVNIYPTWEAYDDLGTILASLGDYAGAAKAYHQGWQTGGDRYQLYQDMGLLTLVYGDPASNKQFLERILKKFPQSYELWMFVAIQEELLKDNANAKIAITNAARYGQVPESIYNGIMSHKPFTFNSTNLGVSITIR